MSKKNNAKKMEKPEMANTGTELSEDAVDGEMPPLTVVAPGRQDSLTPDEIAAKLKELESMGDDDFESYEDDFWDPEEKGEFIIGIYRGFEDTGKEYVTHLFSVLDKGNGKPFIKRCNGKTILDKKLARGEPGMRCKVTYLGPVGGGAKGQPAKDFDVAWEKRAPATKG